MKSTLSSTAEIEQEIARSTLSPKAKNQLDALFDELERRRATDCARGVRVRDARSAKLAAGLERAIKVFRDKLNKMASRDRASWLQTMIALDPEAYGLERAPDIRLVRAAVRAAEKKGILSQKDPIS